MNTLTCGFIGLGLIGGSIARAVRAAYPKARLLAYDIREDSLQLALQEQVLDEICPAINASFADCDYII